MADSPQVDVEKLVPEKLLTRFSKSGIVLCIILAFALHVVVLGATSLDYIHGLVDPAWKQKQDLLAEQARRQAEAEKLARQNAGRAAPTTRQAASKPAADRPDTGKRKPPKEITTMPAKGEIPKLPGSGISIDETEGR